MKTWRRWVVAMVTFLTTGCNARAPEKGLAAAREVPGDGPRAAFAAPRREAERLALAPVDGPTAIDRQITRLELAASRLPGKADALIALGRAWVRKARDAADPGFYVNAGACADLAEEASPGAALARDLRALVLLNDHRFDDARQVEESVLAGDPDDVLALGGMSDALLELGRFEEASKAAQRMVDLKPSLPSYARASYLRWLQGDDANAKRFVRAAIDAGETTGNVEPRAWAIVQAAQIFWQEGDYEGAETGFEQALAQMPNYPPALVGKGRVSLSRGDGARAASYFERAYAESPLVETAWLLGDARSAAGDENGAAEAYGRVESRGKLADPRTLSLFYSTKGIHATESLALAQAEAKTRGDIYTDDALAWALYRAGQTSDARRAIDRATRLGTRDARLLYHAGAIRMAQGDATGRALVAKALALNPRFDASGSAEATALLEGRHAR